MAVTAVRLAATNTEYYFMKRANTEVNRELGLMDML